MTLTVGSLFSGIGGLDLGLERAGMEVIWQSEIDPYASKVLKKHWPDVPNLGDITTIDWTQVERPDLICGGFPCQDLSSSHTANGGNRRGLDGSKSGLWSYYREAVDALRPRWVVVENVNQYQRWVVPVQQQLSDLGYSSAPIQVPAGSVGAPHIRRRIFLVANPDQDGESVAAVYAKAQELRPVARPGAGWPAAPPESLRVDDGVPDRLHRNRALGNAVVPQVAEVIGRIIVESDTATTSTS